MCAPADYSSSWTLLQVNEYMVFTVQTNVHVTEVHYIVSKSITNYIMSKSITNYIMSKSITNFIVSKSITNYIVSK